MEYKQEEILIGEVKVPIIREDDVIYYPISFMMSRVLLKKTEQGSLHKEYSQYIKKFNIDYGRDTGGIRNDVNCISEEGWKKTLENIKIGRLDVDQRKAMNVLLDYFGMDLISEDERFLRKVSKERLSKWGYNEYIMDCIKYVLDSESDIVWQKCTKCDNYYPYHINFYDVNPHSGKEYPLYTVCRDCKGWDHNRSKTHIKGEDNRLSNIYNEYGIEIYRLYKEHNTIEIYNHWRKLRKNKLPYILQNNLDKQKIIKYMYDKGEFEKHGDLNDKTINDVCRFKIRTIGIKTIYEYVLGFSSNKANSSLEGVKQIINNYIRENDIIIDDIFEANYYETIIRGCGLNGFLLKCYNNSVLDFLMDYYDNEYPAYKFKGGFIKYWESKENRIRALKYFIEEDMKIKLEKVPLYITLTALRNKGTSTMYTVCKKYYSSLFEWVNEVYPERFNPKDFDIHYVRNDFDSMEEAEVHDVLKSKFKNVIYNPNHTDRTITIDGKVPDWFLFTDKRCYIGEYFGLDVDRTTSHNSRIEDYKERTLDKIEKYDKLDGYGKLYIFPDDLKDNFKGLLEKLELIE